MLVVDDEKNIRRTLAVCLEDMGCEVVAAASAEAAVAAIAQRPFEIAFVDLKIGESSGLDLLPKLLAESPSLAAVVLTAYATFDTAVEAIKRGAVDYLPKPFTPDQIRHLVGRLAERMVTLGRLAELDQQLKLAVPETVLETRSPKMQAALDVLGRAADSEVAVLLRGESGTGKGVLARTLHAQSRRRTKPFVVVNCPTLSENLLTSELFGHAKGAFTGAVRDQPGRVEAAEGGTLFLDEVAEITPGLQSKLLRFLQEKQFERLGETRTRKADVRVVAATNRDLEVDVKSGHFREDLLFRLNVIEIHVPALRDRPEDLLILTRRFLVFFARAVGRPTPEISKATEEVLLHYAWPGNVRELRNVMERAVILWPAHVIEPQALPERMQAQHGAAPQLGGDFSLEDIERQHVLSVLARTPTLDDAARVLGIDSSTLWRKARSTRDHEDADRGDYRWAASALTDSVRAAPPIQSSG